MIAGLALLAGLPCPGGRADDRTPAEEYQALLKAYQQGQKDFNDAYQAAKTDAERQQVLTRSFAQASAQNHAPGFLKLIQRHPDDPTALDAFRWLVSSVRDAAETRRAADVIIRHWAGSDQIVPVIQSLRYYPCDAGVRVLRAVIAQNADRPAQGYARYSLALGLKAQVEQRSQGTAARTDPRSREAEKLLEEVVARYADLEGLGGTLGKAAEAELFEIRRLAVGMVAPEIEGEDLDGKPFKLSDYRGKVVLLDFWGSW
jgi:hypothetical protein